MSSADRDKLAHWRAIGTRHTLGVLDLAPRVLKAGGLGEEEWAVREQLAFAALDAGHLSVAEPQISALQRKFPGSPRVTILQGVVLEAQGQDAGARKLYRTLLDLDETNVAAHQRLIALLLPQGPNTVIPALLEYLDTFYTDAAGWSLLSEQYATAGMHAQALSALGHVTLIQPWDSDAVERSGALAYTIGDYHLALKHYLRAIEMCTPPEGQIEPKVKTRSWWCLRQAVEKLLSTKTTGDTAVPAAQQCTPAKLRALRELATERILAAGAKGVEGDMTRKVLGGAQITVVR